MLMHDLLKEFNPQVLQTEYIFHNPKNTENDPRWEWRFDIYAEFGPRMIAIEIDDSKGHYSRKNHEQTKENIAKRKFKIDYLKNVGIDFFSWPPQWIRGKKALPWNAFLEEMHILE